MSTPRPSRTSGRPAPGTGRCGRTGRSRPGTGGPRDRRASGRAADGGRASLRRPPDRRPPGPRTSRRHHSRPRPPGSAGRSPWNQGGPAPRRSSVRAGRPPRNRVSCGLSPRRTIARLVSAVVCSSGFVVARTPYLVTNRKVGARCRPPRTAVMRARPAWPCSKRRVGHASPAVRRDNTKVRVIRFRVPRPRATLPAGF